MRKVRLDDKEGNILASYGRGEWRPVHNLGSETKRLQRYARNSMRKDKRINIRMSSKDLQLLQARALEEGLPYQTLISSILHKYVSRSLLEKERS